VGTGFHPELTGRENIYLNGAVLGMTRVEIDRKFDEIVAFAEVEKFLDTPAKRYSSGMYVRLAFAVAAHLEPEILIVDEVLAVGDAEFQKKCLGKMGEVSKQHGRTVLFVSHNMAAISEMANRALLLRSGSIAIEGPVADAVSTYLSDGTREPKYVHISSSQDDFPHITQIDILTSHPNAVHHFAEPLEIKFWIHHSDPIPNCCFCFQIFNQYQVPVICSSYYHDVISDSGTSTLLSCRFPRLLLNVGQYHLRTWLQEGLVGGEIYQTLDGICVFEVVRIDQTQFAGWRPEICTYHEQHFWTALDEFGDAQVASRAQSPSRNQKSSRASLVSGYEQA
jgi:lipopolysaccharide transport system ATP-binding protein